MAVSVTITNPATPQQVQRDLNDLAQQITATNKAVINSAITVSVKSSPYNAKGDGVTDNISAIRAAVCAVAPSSGTVYFPDGNYMISDTFYWPSGVTLLGESETGTKITVKPGFVGTGAIIDGQYDCKGNGIYGVNPPTSFANGGAVINFTIDGSSAQAGAYGLMCANRNNFLVENVYISSTPQHGLYTGGTNFTGRVQNPVVRHVTLDSTGWLISDQFGGGGIFGARYFDITCINSPASCWDQVDFVSSTLDTVVSTYSYGVTNPNHHGFVWSDFGAVSSTFRNLKLYGSSIHLVGSAGDTRNVPHDDVIENCYLTNAGSSPILINSSDHSNFAYGMKIINTTITDGLDDDVTIGFASYTTLMGNTLSGWAKGGGTHFAVDNSSGYATVIIGNTGINGNYGVWYAEALGSVNNLLRDNFFPGATKTITSNQTTSFEYDSNGNSTFLGTLNIGDGSQPTVVVIKTLTSGSAGPALTINEQDTTTGLRINATNSGFGGDVVVSSVSAVGTEGMSLLRAATSGQDNVYRVSGLGGVMIGTRSKAQLQTLVPTLTDEEFYCSDCTSTVYAVSTGTAAGAWADMKGKTTAIQ